MDIPLLGFSYTWLPNPEQVRLEHSYYYCILTWCGVLGILSSHHHPFWPSPTTVLSDLLLGYISFPGIVYKRVIPTDIYKRILQHTPLVSSIHHMTNDIPRRGLAWLPLHSSHTPSSALSRTVAGLRFPMQSTSRGKTQSWHTRPTRATQVAAARSVASYPRRRLLACSPSGMPSTCRIQHPRYRS